MAGARRSSGVPPTPPGLLRRLGWFALLWLGGVAAVAIVGLAIKLALKH
jgi:hypothetical protein